MISRPAEGSLEDAWRWLNTSPTYDPRQTKATTLRTLTLQYIHFVLSHTLTGHGDSTGVINHHNFDFLLSMMDGFYLHLSYEVVVSISNQGTDPRTGTHFIGPYITRLLRRMGILEGTDMIRVVGRVTSMPLETFRLMGMLHHVQIAKGSSTTSNNTLILSLLLLLLLLLPLSHQLLPFRNRGHVLHLVAPLVTQDQVTCSFTSFRWVHRSMARIAKH